MQGGVGDVLPVKVTFGQTVSMSYPGLDEIISQKHPQFYIIIHHINTPNLFRHKAHHQTVTPCLDSATDLESLQGPSAEQ